MVRRTDGADDGVAQKGRMDQHGGHARVVGGKAAQEIRQCHQARAHQHRPSHTPRVNQPGKRQRHQQVQAGPVRNQQVRRLRRHAIDDFHAPCGDARHVPRAARPQGAAEVTISATHRQKKARRATATNQTGARRHTLERSQSMHGGAGGGAYQLWMAEKRVKVASTHQRPFTGSYTGTESSKSRCEMSRGAASMSGASKLSIRGGVSDRLISR